MTIADRVAAVRDRILSAAAASGRKPDDIVLIAASKGVSPQRIAEASAAGLTDFGENYLREALAKQVLAPAEIQWHFIGRMQSNKVAKIARTFRVIHTIDRMDKARLVSESAESALDVFIEVNIGREPQKGGVLPENVLELAEIVYDLPKVRLKGLMTMGPANQTPEDSRPFFIEMRRLSQSLGLPGVDKLSMGMTADFDVAIQEGATHVRIGSGLFGPRL